MSTSQSCCIYRTRSNSLSANGSEMIGNISLRCKLIFNGKSESSTFRLRLLEMSCDEAKRYLSQKCKSIVSFPNRMHMRQKQVFVLQSQYGKSKYRSNYATIKHYFLFNEKLINYRNCNCRIVIICVSEKEQIWMRTINNKVN